MYKTVVYTYCCVVSVFIDVLRLQHLQRLVLSVFFLLLTGVLLPLLLLLLLLPVCYHRGWSAVCTVARVLSVFNTRQITVCQV